MNIHSKDTRAKGDIKKLDANGTFTQFDGITIVMMLKTDLSEMFEEMNRIVPKTSHALLPVASYHVTLSGLTCRNQFDTCEEYNKYVEKLYPKLKAFQEGILPVDCVNFILDDSLMENNKFPQITGYMKVSDDKTEQYFNKVTKLGKELLGDVFSRSKPHLSLAYRLPNGKSMKAEEKKQLSEVLKRHLSGKVLSFDMPQVCKFENMCHFEPIF